MLRQNPEDVKKPYWWEGIQLSDYRQLSLSTRRRLEIGEQAKWQMAEAEMSSIQSALATLAAVEPRSLNFIHHSFDQSKLTYQDNSSNGAIIRICLSHM